MRPLSVMIVDDSATSRTYVAKNLEVAQIPIKESIQAINGKEAWDALQTKSPDMIFLDINMPVMTGIELVEKMAEKGLLTKIAVVIISSEGNQQRIDRLQSLGVKKFLRKPFTPEMFTSLAEEYFGGGGR